MIAILAALLGEPMMSSTCAAPPIKGVPACVQLIREIRVECKNPGREGRFVDIGQMKVYIPPGWKSTFELNPDPPMAIPQRVHAGPVHCWASYFWRPIP